KAMRCRVVRKIAIDLERGVSRTNREQSCLDMKAAALSGNVHWWWKKRAPLRVHSKGIRDGVDIFAERYEAGQLFTGQHDERGRELRVHAQSPRQASVAQSLDGGRLTGACVSLPSSYSGRTGPASLTSPRCT